MSMNKNVQFLEKEVNIPHQRRKYFIHRHEISRFAYLIRTILGKIASDYKGFLLFLLSSGLS